MQKPKTWRELLKQVITDTREKERIARILRKNPMTLMRWVSNTSQPHSKNLHLLLKALPTYRDQLLPLILAEFPDFLDEETPVIADVPHELPSDLYAKVFSAYSIYPDTKRFWPICELILHEAIEQLDPHNQGMEITVARCWLHSKEQVVRYLHEEIGIGTEPWSIYMEQKTLFLGLESLAGFVASTGHERIIQNLKDDYIWFPAQKALWEESVAVYPIMKLDALGGCLLVSSTRLNYFTPARLKLIKEYASLLVLAFPPDELYAPQTLVLRHLPRYDVQSLQYSTFRDRVEEIMKDAAAHNRPIHVLEAERMAWEQVADELVEKLLEVKS